MASSRTLYPAESIDKSVGKAINETIDESTEKLAGSAVEWKPQHLWSVVAVVFLIGAFKGLRLPNLWSTTQMLLNYNLGFIRRGLVGEVLWQIGGTFFGHYYALVFIAYLILGVASIGLGYFIVRFVGRQPQHPGPLLVVLVFAASPGFVWFLHEVGYFDYFGLIATLFVIHFATRTPGRKHVFFLMSTINLVLAFIHESLILMFTPAMCFVLICHITRQIDCELKSMTPRKIYGLFALATSTVLISFAASATIGVVGTREPPFVAQLHHYLNQLADFPLRGDVLGLLSRPVKENLFSLMPNYWAVPHNQRFLINGLIASAPSICFLVYYGFRCIDLATNTTWQRHLLKLNLIAAGIAPLTMNFLGWDCPRWNAVSTLAILCCIFGISLIRLQGKGDHVHAPVLSSRGFSLGVLALFLGLCTNYSGFLFDSYTVRWFPFDQTFDSIVNIYNGGFTFRPAA